jgi:hypothetical protein
LYIDGNLVVKNDGLHELSEYCADRTLTAGILNSRCFAPCSERKLITPFVGTHAVDVTGFMNDGHPGITVTYRYSVLQVIVLFSKNNVVVRAQWP